MTITALSTVKHNGVVYQKGQTLEDVKDNELQALLDAGVVETDEKVARKPKKEDETPPEKSVGTVEDKKAEEKGITEVANLPISTTLSKEKLIGIARANGLEVEKTATRSEVYNMIKEFRVNNNIVVEGDPASVKSEAGEGATPGADDKTEDAK